MRKILPLLVAILIVMACPIGPNLPLPHTLLFSPITPEYLRDTVEKWEHARFSGFMLSGIMSNWDDDIWATDGDASTRGKDDGTYQRVKSCNDVCRKYGISENFIKVAFYKHVPLWIDDAAWSTLYENFRQAARFARMTGCRGIALDIEYVSEQYNLDWEGYDYQGYSQQDLRTAAVRRGRELVRAMLEAYPDMVFLNLPEGHYFYGPLASDFIVGMVNGMAEANAKGGFHLLTERTYSMTKILGLLLFAQKVEKDLLKMLDDSARSYWRERCSIALGGWPLGYYREVFDENGNFLGYSGREETFGNKVVGSYADKSARFSPEEFRQQYAGMLMGSKYYCWIYGHGATWWQFSPEDVKKYGNVGNSALPVDENLQAYIQVVRRKWIPTDWRLDVAKKVRKGEARQVIEELGFVKALKVIGPFGCKTCDNFDRVFPPEQEIELDRAYAAGNLSLQWKTLNIEPETGYLDLAAAISPKDWVCAYAFCKVISLEERPAQIRLGTNDTGTLWFNGEKIFAMNGERGAQPDDDILPVQLRKGENTILVKVCNTERYWGMYLRITDEKGGPLSDLRYWPDSDGG